MDQRLVTKMLLGCLVVSLVGNVWMLLENRRLLNEWDAADPGTVQVHVLGAVLNPGVYHLPAGSRISDALQSAGGLAPEAAPGQMNLAKPLFDGEQVTVPFSRAVTQAGGDEGTSEVPSRLLNINSASVEELDELPYIGPAKAEAIIAYRQEHGAFSRVEDLLNVPGIGEATLAKFKHLVTVE